MWWILQQLTFTMLTFCKILSSTNLSSSVKIINAICWPLTIDQVLSNHHFCNQQIFCSEIMKVKFSSLTQWNNMRFQQHCHSTTYRSRFSHRTIADLWCCFLFYSRCKHFVRQSRFGLVPMSAVYTLKTLAAVQIPQNLKQCLGLWITEIMAMEHLIACGTVYFKFSLQLSRLLQNLFISTVSYP